jgi:hypothetical protein
MHVMERLYSMIIHACSDPRKIDEHKVKCLSLFLSNTNYPAFQICDFSNGIQIICKAEEVILTKTDGNND